MEYFRRDNLARRKEDNSGFVAIISVMAVVLFISLVAASAVSLAISNRSYNNNEILRTQALLSAESGVEEMADLVSQLIAEGKSRAEIESEAKMNSCDIADRINNNYPGSTSASLALSGKSEGTAVGCLRARFVPATAEPLTAQQLETKTWFIDTAAAQSIRISWTNIAAANGGRSDSVNTDITSWDATGGLSVQLAGFGPTRSAIEEHTSFIRPRSSGGGAGPITSSEIPASCSAGSCQVVISGIGSAVPANFRWVNLTPTHHAVDVTVEVLDGSGSVLGSALTNMVVDSTGRAARVWRRIEREVSLTPNSQNSSDLPGAVLYAGKGICKNFIIDNTNTVTSGTRNPTCP